MHTIVNKTRRKCVQITTLFLRCQIDMYGYILFFNLIAMFF